jgi:uncharacterized protein (DUF1778 family)
LTATPCKYVLLRVRCGSSLRIVQLENVQERSFEMSRSFVEDNKRLALRVHPDDKAILMRAVAIEHTDMTNFVLRHALGAARRIIQRAERLNLSERDSLRVLDALENPPLPNAKLLAAANHLPQSA